MASLTEFFNLHEEDALKGIIHKNSVIKRSIIAHMAVNGECTLSELTKELHISVPTITKLVQELVDENIVTDLGKVETPGGRRPNIFGLANSAIYFAGVNVGRDNLRFIITDLQNNIIKEELDATFELLDRPQCLERICSSIEHFIATCGIDRAKILGLGRLHDGPRQPRNGPQLQIFHLERTVAARPARGARGHPRAARERHARPLLRRVHVRQIEEREQRALPAYGPRRGDRHRRRRQTLLRQERLRRRVRPHPFFFDNEIICSCGKKGCLETEVSGIAIEEKMSRQIAKGVNTILREQYDRQKTIHIDDIIAAAKNDDNLSIELIEEAGEKVGKAVAFLINTFNPETVIVGGNLSAAGDYIMLPLKSATNKYSLNLVYKDTKFRVSKMSDNANAWGVAMLIRNKVIGL